MSTPTLSVIMGVYNGEKHLQQAVLSILAQSYEDFELIIVNDGSKDGTLEVLQSFSDSRIKIITTENQGLTKSLNLALSFSKGEYIARQDADDISLNTRFEKQIKLLKSDDELYMVGSSMYVSNAKGLFNEVFYYPTQYEDIKQVIAQYNPFVHGSVMFKKAVVEKEGGYDESYRYVQDYELWSRIVPKYKSINIKEPLYARLREGDCSESNIDKTEYVNKIQLRIQDSAVKAEPNNSKKIVAKSIYPYIGWPRLECSKLSKTFKEISAQAKINKFRSEDYIKKSRCYYPWSFFE